MGNRHRVCADTKKLTDIHSLSVKKQFSSLISSQAKADRSTPKWYKDVLIRLNGQIF
jgi:hypothetical protein